MDIPFSAEGMHFNSALQKFRLTLNCDEFPFRHFKLSCAVGAQKNRLLETVFYSSQSTCSPLEIRKITFQYTPIWRTEHY